MQNGSPIEADWFDMLDRKIKHVESGFNGTFVERVTDYDDMGTVAQQSTPFFVGSGNVYFTGWNYDRLNRPTLKTSQVSELDSVHGDVDTSYSYAGNKTSIKVRGALVPATCSSSTNLCMDMSRSYDVLGRLEQTVQNNGSTANYATTNYWYDGTGNAIAIKDAEGNVIQASYDALGRRTQVIDPDAGTRKFTYDGFGETLTETNARNIATTHIYDILGRLTQRTATDANAADATMKVIRDNWSYDPIGTTGGM